MRRLISLFFSCVLAIGCMVLACCSGNAAAASSGKPMVLCTIFSYYDAARAIAGDKLDVRILLPPDASPHEYETTARDKKTAADAALFIINGLGLDDRYQKLVDASKTKILNISDQIPKTDLLATKEIPLDEPGSAPPGGAKKEEEDESAGEGGANPHVWLDPHIQMAAAKAIRDAFIALDPAAKATFQANADAYLATLNKLDTDFAAAAAGFKTKDFIGFHSAYEYLARRYGLHQIASIEEVPGTGLSPAQAQRIVKLINDDHIHYIAVESAFPESSAKFIENQTGVKTIVLQPLETYDNASASYDSYMRENLKALQTALNG